MFRSSRYLNRGAKIKFNKQDIFRDTGVRLRKIREQLGYTRPEMAERLGMSAGGYRKNESGECFPNAKSLFRLSSEYDVSMDWLFFNKGPMYRKEIKRLEDQGRAEAEGLEQQLADCNAQLQGLEQETAVLRQAAPEVKEMVLYMEQNPILYHELMLYFHRFVRENPQDQPGKKKRTGKQQVDEKKNR
jgi:transcriptional regulator with XRE-family HTH domain